MNKILRSYLVGFFLSLLLTIAAYVMVQVHISTLRETFPRPLLIPFVLAFAFTQLIVQFRFFLRVGKEEKPRWSLYFSIFTFIGILIVILASIWIESHLNYNMMPDQMYKYIQEQSGGF